MNTRLAFIIILIAAIGVTVLSLENIHKTSKTSGTASSTEEKPQTIEEYVRANISKLSPKREVLGGKFYVVGFQAKGGTGVVTYEDGHNAYKADFKYELEKDGEPKVTSFKVR